MEVGIIHVEITISHADGSAIGDVVLQTGECLETEFPGVVAEAADIRVIGFVDPGFRVNNTQADAKIDGEALGQVVAETNVAEDWDGADIATSIHPEVMSREGTEICGVVTSIDAQSEAIAEIIAEFSVQGPAGVEVEGCAANRNVLQPECAAGDIVIPASSIWSNWRSGLSSSCEHAEGGEERETLQFRHMRVVFWLFG